MLTEIFKQIVKHSSVYSLNILLTSIASVLLLPVYTRYLTKADYGTLALVDQSVYYIKILFTLGGAAAVNRFFNFYENDTDKKTVISTGVWLAVISSSVGGLFLIANSQPLAHVFFGNAALYKIIDVAAVILISETVLAVSLSYFAAVKESKIYVVYGVSQLAMSISANLFFIIYLKLGVFGMVYGQALSNCIICFISTGHVLLKNGVGFERAKLKMMISFGLPLIPATIFASLMHNVDQYLLRYFKGLETVGIYALGYKIPFAINSLFIVSINLIWGSALMFEIYKLPDAREIYSKITTYLISIFIFLMFITSIFSEYIIRILASEAYYSSYHVIPIVCLGLIPYALHNFISIGVTIYNKTWLFPVSNGIAALLNVLVNLILIPQYGYMGAAWATVITYFSFICISWQLYKNVYYIRFEWVRLTILTGICILFYILSTLVSTHNEALKICYLTGICLSLPLLLYMIGYFNKEEKNKLNELIKQFVDGVIRNN